MTTTIATELCTQIYNETYGALPVSETDDDDYAMTVDQGIAIAQVAFDAAMLIVAPLLAENVALKNEIAVLKLPTSASAAAPVQVPVVIPMKPSRSMNSWNIFQKLFSVDFPNSLETVSSVYKIKCPTKEAKDAYFKANVARALAFDAKKGKKVTAPDTRAVEEPVVAVSRATNYNVFFAAMTLGQEGSFEKSDEIKIWEEVPDAEKQNWKVIAPHWKTMPAEVKAKWVERAQMFRTVKA
jgi:hypothetical protein